MKINASRRWFLRGLSGAAALTAAGGCFSIGGADRGKIRLAVVGLMGKGYSDWTPMLRSGLVKIVALCDVDFAMREKAQARLIKDGLDCDLYSVPFYTDYRRLMDDAGLLGIDAMTVSTPDHAHGPIAISAMKRGIHVFVQKPLVRTLWELDYFGRTAKENGVIVQMGNQASSLDSMRRCTEVIQSGILGDVTEVHVWTNRAVWTQGRRVAEYVRSRGEKGDPINRFLNWNAWIGAAKMRPFLNEYPAGFKAYDPWKLGNYVYLNFAWRAFHDFGAGAFGDMACHTMNLPFRGLELAGVTEAECLSIEEKNDIAFPKKSVVKMVYAPRASKIQRNADGSAKTLPAVTLLWYDGYDETKPGVSANKPAKELMPKVVSTFGDVPNTGCYIIGSKGAVLMQDDYGGKCAIALNDETKFVDIFAHEASKAVPRRIPYCEGSSATIAGGKSTIAMQGFAEGHYVEFLKAICGVGPYYEETHSRCFSDVEYCVPQMEGILVGCIAQQVAGRLRWNGVKQSFEGNTAANALVKPYIREGWAY